MTILITLLEGATIRELLPYEKLFDHEAAQILPILHEIENKLIAVRRFPKHTALYRSRSVLKKN